MFAIDIFYFHKFYLFYKALILLLYPLTIESLIYALKDYAEEGKLAMEKYAIPSFDDVTENGNLFGARIKKTILIKIILINSFLVILLYM